MEPNETDMKFKKYFETFMILVLTDAFQLTGIIQDMVDGQPNLTEVLEVSCLLHST